MKPRNKSKTVYVDAKILGRHDPNLPHKAYVGYFVDGGGRKDAKGVNAEESDDAEVEAILFAIEGLAGAFAHMTIVCDHQSVVSEANRRDVKKSSSRMQELRNILRLNRSSIKLKALKANPAHKVVTEYVNKLKGQDREIGEVLNDLEA